MLYGAYYERWEFIDSMRGMLHWVGEAECASPLVTENGSEKGKEEVEYIEVLSEWERDEKMNTERDRSE